MVTVWGVARAADLPNGDVSDKELQYKAKPGEAPKSAWSKPNASVNCPSPFVWPRYEALSCRSC
jgi:hypothetical protein